MEVQLHYEEVTLVSWSKAIFWHRFGYRPPWQTVASKVAVEKHPVLHPQRPKQLGVLQVEILGIHRSGWCCQLAGTQVPGIAVLVGEVVLHTARSEIKAEISAAPDSC